MAIVCSHSGIMVVGNSATEANISGRLRRLISPNRVSWFSTASAMVVNSEVRYHLGCRVAVLPR